MNILFKMKFFFKIIAWSLRYFNPVDSVAMFLYRCVLERIFLYFPSLPVTNNNTMVHFFKQPSKRKTFSHQYLKFHVLSCAIA